MQGCVAIAVHHQNIQKVNVHHFLLPSIRYEFSTLHISPSLELRPLVLTTCS